MAKKSIDIIISTVLKKTGIDAAGAALKSLSARAASFGKAVGSNLMNIKAGFDMAVAAARKFMEVIKLGVEFERMTYGFKSLVGSIDDARKHMADLQELGRTPPFDLQSFASASREILKLSGGVLGFKDDLKIVGDMAAATGNDIRTVGHAFGLAYQSIRDGEGFGRAGSQLVQLGILTKKQVKEFDELTKSGKSNAEVWDEFVKVVSRYDGAMADVEKTTGGVIDAIGGEATLAMTKIGEAIGKGATPALEKFYGWLKRLNDDGTITSLANNIGKVLGGAINGIAWVLEKAKDGIVAVTTFAQAADKAFHDGKWYDVAGQVRAGASAVRDRFAEKEEDPIVAETKRIEEAAKKEREEAERTAKVREDLARAEAEKRAQAEYEAELKLREQVESRADFEAELERKKIEKAEKEYEDAIREREEVEKKAAQEMERELFRQKAANLKKLHDQQMDALDKQKDKLDEQIAKLKEMGAENPFRMAQGLDQGAMLREERQGKIDEARFEKARDALEKRMRRAGIDPNGDLKDVSKMGRLSNLERAALERMRLDRAKKDADAIEKKKIKLAEDTKKELEKINASLAAGGM